MSDSKFPLGYGIIISCLSVTCTVESLHVEDRMYHLPDQEHTITIPAPVRTIGTVTAPVNGTLFGLLAPGGI
jgi:hypothetical protein